jgi:hypothetical protein
MIVCLFACLYFSSVVHGNRARALGKRLGLRRMERGVSSREASPLSSTHVHTARARTSRKYVQIPAQNGNGSCVVRGLRPVLRECLAELCNARLHLSLITLHVSHPTEAPQNLPVLVSEHNLLRSTVWGSGCLGLRAESLSSRCQVLGFRV